MPVKVTVAQRQAVELARSQGGRITSRDAIEAKLGPSTCSLLTNKGVFRDLGRMGSDTQHYELRSDAPELTVT